MAKRKSELMAMVKVSGELLYEIAHLKEENERLKAQIAAPPEKAVDGVGELSTRSTGGE